MDAITPVQTRADTTSNVPKDAVVWFEIPVTDMQRSKAFYSAVLKASFNDENGGPNPMANFVTQDPQSGVSGHLYPGKPAPDGVGPTIHLAAPEPLEETLERVAPNGGKVVSPIIKIPPGDSPIALTPTATASGSSPGTEPRHAPCRPPLPDRPAPARRSAGHGARSG
jgi:predicted enzyme related to lactoylglutathione lyase